MCNPDRDRLADWLAGWLDPVDAQRVADHVNACPACRDEADALARLAAEVRTASAQRLEGLAVPAYRPVPTRPARPVRPGVAFAGTLRRMARPVAPAAARLRAATGLMAAVVIAVGAVAWRAGAPRPAERRTLDRPEERSIGHRDVALAPAEPTLVLRQPTAVHRAVAAPPVARAKPLGEAAPRTEGSSSIPPQAARIAFAPPDAPVRAEERPTEASRAPSADGGASTAEAEHPTESPPDPTTPPGTDAPLPEPSASAAPTEPPTAPPTSPAPPSPAPPSPAPPSPTPPAPVATPAPVVPTIAGLVIGADGAPLAGARVRAEPFDGGALLGATTGPDGRYAIDVAPGRWLVRAEADGYALMWRGGAPSPQRAGPIDVSAEAGRAVVDFALEPAALERIRGRVIDAAGSGVPGALVVAARPGDRAVDVAAPSAAVYADADGAYALPITPGGWLVAATTDWRRGALAWWGGDGSIAQADRVPVDADRAADGIDLHIRP